jgi:hypothetical protein
MLTSVLIGINVLGTLVVNLLKQVTQSAVVLCLFAAVLFVGLWALAPKPVGQQVAEDSAGSVVGEVVVGSFI